MPKDTTSQTPRRASSKPVLRFDPVALSARRSSTGISQSPSVAQAAQSSSAEKPTGYLDEAVAQADFNGWVEWQFRDRHLPADYKPPQSDPEVNILEFDENYPSRKYWEKHHA